MKNLAVLSPFSGTSTQATSNATAHVNKLLSTLVVSSVLLVACTDQGEVAGTPVVTTQTSDTSLPAPTGRPSQQQVSNQAADAEDNSESENNSEGGTETDSTTDVDAQTTADQNNTATDTGTEEETAPPPPVSQETAVETSANPTNTIPQDPTAPVIFANTELGAFVPASPPIASVARAPAQPIDNTPIATEGSPPIPPVTTAPDSVDINSNQAPYFENLDDIVVFAGQVMNLRVIPRDGDRNVPGLFTGPLPEGARFVDNFDGTKTITWRPLEPDVGLHTIEITAIDAVEPLYRTLKTVRVFVKLPADLSSIENLPPAIDQIRPHRARAGDEIVMLVKGTDPNGYVPRLEILNPTANSSFGDFPEDDRIRVFRWQTALSDTGIHTFRFRVTDAKDASMVAERTVTLELSHPNAFVRPGPRLRTLAERRGFHIGFAALLNYHLRPDSGLYTQTAASEYSLLTTENSVKWGQLNPQPNVWRWDAFDREMQFSHSNNLLMHGHPLVWHRQLPEWIKTLPSHQHEGVMLDYISHVVSRYRGHVALWDVVNEAFEDDGTWRNSVWFKSMGESFVAKAFRQAHLSSPQSRLIYNDYDVAWEGPKADAMYQLVKQLVNDGVPIHGVGFQMHLDVSFDRFDSVRRNFQRFADLGLEVFITEFDVALNGVNADEEIRQADIYRQVLGLCLTQSACKALQVWGLTDRYSWRRDRRVLPFDENFNAKGAYYSLQQRLSESD